MLFNFYKNCLFVEVSYNEIFDFLQVIILLNFC